MKNPALFLTLLLFSCQNESGNSSTPMTDTTAQTAPATPTEVKISVLEADTVYGIPGAEMAHMKMTGYQNGEFAYEKYLVKTTADTENAGETITVFSNEGAELWKKENGAGGNFFYGISHDHIFVDDGTGPDGREILAFNLKKNKPGFQGPYIGEMSISEEGVLNFYISVSAKAAGKTDCPEKKEWEKNGLGIGYGQLNQYALKTGKVSKKNSFKCFPMQ